MTNENLFKSFQKGNLEPLYKEVYPRMILYTARILGKEYAFLAEDCVQDAIFQTYRKRHDIQTASAFLTFLYSCAYNAAISILRKQSARNNYLSSLHIENEEDFTHTLIAQEMLDLLYRAIDNLPPKYQMLFNLSFEQGLKNAEVAQLLQVSESAVKKQKAQFIRLLRKKLQQISGADHATLLAFVLSIMKQ